MRGSEPGGRFTIPEEIDRYSAGINEDLRNPAGGVCRWWRFDEYATQVDPIYDVGAGTGRNWKGPIPVPFISAHIAQGQTFQDERGYYNADVVRFLFNVKDLERIFPGSDLKTDDFLRDRIEFTGKRFRPSRAQLDGLVLNRWTIFVVDAIEVKEEEEYNDSQFTGDDPELPLVLE